MTHGSPPAAPAALSQGTPSEQRGDIIQELRRENAGLRLELERLKQLNKTRNTAERLHETQAEIRTLQDKVMISAVSECMQGEGKTKPSIST